MTSIYLDTNATTPLDPAVLEGMEPFLRQHYANPSGIYSASRIASKAIREARRKTAQLLESTSEEEIVFTSGGTESINTAIRSSLKTQRPRNEIMISSVEHASVKRLAMDLKDEGMLVHEINVDASGQICLDEMKEKISERVALVSMMLANNETGVIFPIQEIGSIAKQYGALFHVDAVQAIAKIPVSVKESSIDFLSLSAHKFYGPKGAGALFVRRGLAFHPLIFGGSQERGRRAGTENIPGIIGLGLAAQIAKERPDEDAAYLQYLRDEFEYRVTDLIPDAFIHSKDRERLPNTSNLHFTGIDAEVLIISLDQDGICASRGSACMSGAHEPSHVLKAMDMKAADAKATIRISFGKYNTKDELDVVIERLEHHVERLRNLERDASQSLGKETVKVYGSTG